MNTTWPSDYLKRFAERYGKLLYRSRSGRTLVDVAYCIGSNELARCSDSLRGTPGRQRRLTLRRSFGSGRNIEIGVLDNIETNGLATAVRSKDGWHISTLSLGFLTAIASIVVALWQDPYFMPWIRSTDASIKRERYESFFIDWLQLALHEISAERRCALGDLARRLTLDDLFDGIIQCPLRRAGATLMYTDCIRFGWLHEFGHILLGHTSASLVQEVPSKLEEDIKSLLKQTSKRHEGDREIIELAADNFAGRMLVEEKLLFRNGRYDVNPDLLLIASLSATLFGVLFHALNMLDNPHPTSSYPPAWARAYATLSLMRTMCKRHEELRKNYGKFFVDLERRYLSSVRSISKVNILFGEALEPNLSKDFEEVASSYFADLKSRARCSSGVRSLRPWFES